MDKIYGQLNQLRETIMNKVTENEDLLKFIYYCDLNEINKVRKSLGLPEYLTIDKTDILSLPNLTKDQRKSLINTQIFKYKRMPLNSQTDAKCFLSMQYLGVNRNRKEPYFMMPYFEFTVVCPDAIAEISNGNRILAIEECLVQLYDMKDVGGIGNCRVLISEPEKVDTGYQSRKTQIVFVDWIDRK